MHTILYEQYWDLIIMIDKEDDWNIFFYINKDKLNKYYLIKNLIKTCIRVNYTANNNSYYTDSHSLKLKKL